MRDISKEQTRARRIVVIVGLLGLLLLCMVVDKKKDSIVSKEIQNNIEMKSNSVEK